MNRFLELIARFLIRLGVTANLVTLCGFAFSLPAAYLIANGHLFAGACMICLSGISDLLDGKIARLQKTAGAFGALLDSSLDRYSDSIYYSSLVWYFFSTGRPLFAALALSAMAGAFEISYVRARSEGLGQKCTVGFWERGERTVFLITALFVGNPVVAVIWLGTLTHLTALKRILHTRKVMAGDAAELRLSRSSPTYLAQAFFFLASLWFYLP